jgi:hypothetical protein
VPHVSNAALLRMEFLTPAAPCDNVLLEWTVALELEAQRPDLRVLRDPFSAKPHVLFYATKRVGGDVSDFAAIKLLKFATA